MHNLSLYSTAHAYRTQIKAASEAHYYIINLHYILLFLNHTLQLTAMSRAIPAEANNAPVAGGIWPLWCIVLAHCITYQEAAHSSGSSICSSSNLLPPTAQERQLRPSAMANKQWRGCGGGCQVGLQLPQQVPRQLGMEQHSRG